MVLILYRIALLTSFCLGCLSEDHDPRSHYEMLECSKECTKEEMKRSYRKLALRYHPDKLGSQILDEDREKMNAEFLKVQLAYETLSDPQKKLQYDLSFEGVQYDIR